MATEAERNHYEFSDKISSDVNGIAITENIAREFLAMLPKGRLSAKPSYKIVKEMAKNQVFKNFNHPDLGLVQKIADITLVKYLFPLGSCVKGRYIMQNEEDRHYAMQFLENKSTDKARFNEDGVTKYKDVLTLRYRALRKVRINGEDFGGEMAEKAREEIPTDETIEQINEVVGQEQEELPPKLMEEPSAVSIKKVHNHLTLIVIKPDVDYSDLVDADEFIPEWEMDIESICDHEEILGMVCHLLEKKWVTKSIVQDFIGVALKSIGKGKKN